MLTVLSSNAVDRGFEPRSGEATKDYTIGICCFSDKQAGLRRKSKDWFARNQNNVPECSDMSSHWKPTCSSRDIADKLLFWRLSTHSLTHSLTHSPWRRMKRCHGPLYYDRKFQIFIFLTVCCIEYTSTWAGFEVITLVEIGIRSRARRLLYLLKLSILVFNSNINMYQKCMYGISKLHIFSTSVYF